MTVSRVDVWQAKPGQAQDLIDLFRDARIVLEQMGCANANLVMAGAGSRASGLYYSVAEWENTAAYGRKYTDAGSRNSEWQAIVGRALAADAPGTHAGSLLINEVASHGTVAKVEPGNTTIVRGWKVKPGRFQDFVSLVASAGPHHSKAGGWSRLHATMAGDVDEINAWTTAHYPSAEAAGAFMDQINAALLSGSDMRELVSRSLAEDAPADQVVVRLDTVVA